jgi:hypothetical protein
VVLGKYQCLQNDFEQISSALEKNQAIINASMEKVPRCNTKQIAVCRNDIYNYPKCSDEDCRRKHGNYINLLGAYDELYEDRMRVFALGDKAINGNQGLWRQYQSETDINTKKIEQVIRDRDNIIFQYNNLRADYQNLREIQTDPFCRDTEILKLREEAASQRAFALDRNTVAANANQQYMNISANYDILEEKVKELEKEIMFNKRTIAKQNETIEAFRAAQPEELRTRRIGLCTDYVCSSKINDLNYKLSQLRGIVTERDAQIETMSQEKKQAEKLSVYWKEQHNLALKNETLDQDHKRKAEEAPVKIVTVRDPPANELVAHLDPDLSVKFNSLFMVSSGSFSSLEENKLYDNFLMDQPENQRLGTLAAMYSACHHGEGLPDRDKKKYKHDLTGEVKDSSRIGKRSFSACLKALGGISTRKNSKTIWVNIHMRRIPIFERTELPSV